MNHPDPQAVAALYAAHFDCLCARFDTALERSGHEAVVIGSGTAMRYFGDDQGPPFKANPQIMQWLPLAEHPDACLLYRPGHRPVLAVVQAADYWHEPPQLPGEPWSRHIEIRCVGSIDGMVDVLGNLPAHTALLGPPEQWATLPLKGEPNPRALTDCLAWQRGVKTAWEVDCLRRATARSIRGHRAAAETFRHGASEFDILMAFLGACRCTSAELPYPAIVAGGAHAATLHYQHYDRDRPVQHSLLIDAGCSHFGYAADITRCHAAGHAGDFGELIAALDRLQQSLCAQLRPGIPFADLHHQAHLGLACLLAETGLIDASADAIIDAGATLAFLPHGLGHLLGLQVHDVGGQLASPRGELLSAPENYPRLRLLRRLEPGMVLTIEPGLYFIDSLLAGLRDGPIGRAVDQAWIDRLRRYGGIRIEDNLLITEAGAENLTREAFATIGAAPSGSDPR